MSKMFARLTKTFGVAFAGALLLLAVASASPALAASATEVTAAASGSLDDFLVQYDQVELMRLNEDASTVIVGNPSIADVSIQAGRLLAITGKTFGVTNLIVLNHANQIMINRRLIVRADDQKIVNLNRGVQRETYNCVPKCRSVLTIGDEQAYYSRLAKASTDKFRVSDAIAEGGGSGQ